MKVVRASNSAAVIEIAAKRSPIGKAMIFFSQRIRGLRSLARHSRPSRRRSVICAGAGGERRLRASSSTSSASTGSVIREAGRGRRTGSRSAAAASPR